VGQVAAKSVEKAKRAEENATTLVAAAPSAETVAVPVAAAANRSVAALPIPTAEELPSLTLDDEMLNRSRAEIHDGAEVLKIDRPVDLDRPGTEVINVYFGLGDTQPNAEGAADTKEVGQRILQMYQARKSIPEIYVEGHADRTGDWKLNYEIAHRRAAATKTILIDAGVPDSWIQISDYSEQNLAVPTEDGVGNWRNRRVEVTVIPTGDDEAQRSEASVN
jgi:outer membrane protein OmpA-like peptidoglycan-associated protein